MNTQTNPDAVERDISEKTGYNRFLLLVAGLGGLLYGIDVGIINGALPYLQATFTSNGSLLTAQQISFVVAAFLLGTTLSTVFAGALADLIGRRTLMIVSGTLFVCSIPTISLAHDYESLILGRLLQGASGGLIGVSGPLYLAECLRAANRGKGTGFFQWWLVIGIFSASLIGLYFSYRVDAVARLGDPAKLSAFQDSAWRGIFWVSLPPGLLFVIGGFMVSESPRWLFRRGKIDAARAALRRSRSEEQAEIELKEMKGIAAENDKVSASGRKVQETLLQRKYMIPLLLACVILTCNQATGINSVIGYNTTTLIQAGLPDKLAHLGSVFFNLVNFLATPIAVFLVDRKGRKFLLSLGTAGVVVSMLCAGLLFHKTEKLRVDVSSQLQAMVTTNQTLSIAFTAGTATNLLAGSKVQQFDTSAPSTLVVIYSYGDFSGATPAARSDVVGKPVEIARESCVPANKIVAFLKNPFASLDAAKTAPLKINAALVTPVPSERNGWFAAILLYVYMAFFAIGPGVCVWLALSELMPTRIRSNGMSIALLINQAVSTTIAAVFLPTVGKYGYSAMFFFFAGFTVIYFIAAAFFLPETKGKTLEEIEEYFETKHR